MNPQDFIAQTKNLIARGRVAEALTRLASFLETEHYDEDAKNTAAMLTARHNQLQRAQRMGTISYSEENISRNQINFALLEFLDELGQAEGSDTSEATITEPPTTGVKGAKKTIQQLLQGQEPIKILFLAANSLDGGSLRLDKEMRAVDQVLDRSTYRDQFKLIKVTAATVGDLLQALLKHKPQFVHFAGHGTSKGLAFWDDQVKQAHIVRAEPLAGLFKLFSDKMICVVFNSCYSEDHAMKVNDFIAPVIGMNYVVDDAVAITFATAFYQAISMGEEIRFAYEMAKSAIGLSHASGSDLPIYLD